MENEVLARLSESISFIEDRPGGTISVVPFELVKVEIGELQTKIIQQDEKLNEYRRLLYHTKSP